MSIACALSFHSQALGQSLGSCHESGLVSSEPSASVAVDAEWSLPEMVKSKCQCRLVWPLLKSFIRSPTSHFHIQFTEENCVTWPPLGTKETGECSF